MAIPPNSRIDPIIDYCIKRSQSLSSEIQTLHNDLNSGLLQTSNDLRDRYTPLYEKLVFVIKDLKPAAVSICNNMRYEEAAPLKASIDTATGTLKTKHKNLIILFHEHFHENRFPFPNSLTDFECYCNWPRKFIREKAGWMVAGSAAFISVITLTSFGSYAGPYFAKAPKFFGDACRDLGDFLTNLLSSETIKNAAASEWASTAGKLSLIPAIGYPSYRYLKEPLMKLAKKCDKIITTASEAPMATFITAWALYYTVSRQLGFEGTFAKGYASPFHARLMVTFGAAFATPSAVSAAKDVIDDYKNQSLMKLLHEDPPALFANRRNPFNSNPGSQIGEEVESLEGNEAPAPLPRNRRNPASNRNPDSAPQREAEQVDPPNQNPQANPNPVPLPQLEAQPVVPPNQNAPQNIAQEQGRADPENRAIITPPKEEVRKLRQSWANKLFGDKEIL